MNTFGAKYSVCYCWYNVPDQQGYAIHFNRIHQPLFVFVWALFDSRIHLKHRMPPKAEAVIVLELTLMYSNLRIQFVLQLQDIQDTTYVFKLYS